MGRGNFPLKVKVNDRNLQNFPCVMVKSFPERSTVVDSVNERSQNCGNAEMVQFIYSKFLGVVLRVGLWSSSWAAQGFKQYLIRPTSRNPHPQTALQAEVCKIVVVIWCQPVCKEIESTEKSSTCVWNDPFDSSIWSPGACPVLVINRVTFLSDVLS